MAYEDDLSADIESHSDYRMLRARATTSSVSGRVDPIDAQLSRYSLAEIGVVPSNSQRFL